ncbi:MAG TPA: hypothetical protein VMY99_01855 [Nevskiaceae bacterium]|nr:hypothetical protein [Nevskiaceae bacterium]
MSTTTPTLQATRAMIAGGMLSLAVAATAFVAWGHSNNWQFAQISTYRIFPLFGLLAFSLLWAQYMVLAVCYWRRIDRKLMRRYFETSAFFVLLAIVLHPGLLVYQLWRDGFGLPPESYQKNFVGPGMGWVATLGSISLFIFLAYELRRIFGDRPWWPWVAYASDVAMLLVFYHGLRLGDQLHEGWFRGVWVVYGVLLVGALVYIRGNAYLQYRRRIIKAKGDRA